MAQSAARTLLRRWRGPVSNRRHHGFQACALPTVLPRRMDKRTPIDLHTAIVALHLCDSVQRGRLGEQVRCVVSVSMLTEGWDANTVTQILGVRRFGSQLLCEQVVGRGLRRRGYEPSADGLFEAEYAEVYGVPFAFIPSDRKSDRRPRASPPVPGTASYAATSSAGTPATESRRQRRRPRGYRRVDSAVRPGESGS